VTLWDDYLFYVVFTSCVVHAFPGNWAPSHTNDSMSPSYMKTACNSLKPRLNAVIKIKLIECQIMSSVLHNVSRSITVIYNIQLRKNSKSLTLFDDNVEH